MRARWRARYWSCAKLADWVRGIKKPMALTHQEWEEWRRSVKSKNPIRFFIAEKLLNRIQDFLSYPFDIWSSFRFFYKNKFITKTHFLKTGLKSGVYHELDDRILHGLFNELKEFVEIELANMQTLSKECKFKKGRCPDAGIDYLKWASKLKIEEPFVDKGDPDYGKLTPQAESSIKILELYGWWLEREKTDPNGLIELTDCYEKIEERYDKDTEMMIELIKIRNHLWT
jgi:hypothetical protein